VWESVGAIVVRNTEAEKVQGYNPLQPVLRAMTTIKILTMINCRHAFC